MAPTTSDQHEIDLVLDLGDRLWAIGIKLTSAPGPATCVGSIAQLTSWGPTSASSSRRRATLFPASAKYRSACSGCPARRERYGGPPAPPRVIGPKGYS